MPNRIRSSSSLGGPQRDVRYRYDALHARTVKDEGSGQATTYIGGLYEKRPGDIHRFKLVTPFGVVAEVEWQTSTAGQDKVSFYHSDSLGTPETISSPQQHSANVQDKVKYEPFGQRRYASALAYPINLPSNHSDGFTGHEADDDFGFINMRGRVYDARVGRFLTADPVVPSAFFSQALNRYSYVANNPLNLVDPSGFDYNGGCISNGGSEGGCYAAGGSGDSSNPGGGTSGFEGAGNPFEWITDLVNDIGKAFKGGSGCGQGPNTPACSGAPPSGGGGTQPRTTQGSATAPSGPGWTTAVGGGAGSSASRSASTGTRTGGTASADAAARRGRWPSGTVTKPTTGGGYGPDDEWQPTADAAALAALFHLLSHNYDLDVEWASSIYQTNGKYYYTKFSTEGQLTRSAATPVPTGTTRVGIVHNHPFDILYQDEIWGEVFSDPAQGGVPGSGDLARTVPVYVLTPSESVRKWTPQPMGPRIDPTGPEAHGVEETILNGRPWYFP